MAFLTAIRGCLSPDQVKLRDAGLSRRQLCCFRERWFKLRRLLGIFIFSLTAQAQATVDEQQVKAAFLFNFAKFVEWPAEIFANGNDPLVMGVLGDEFFYGTLEEVVKGKRVTNREVVVRKIRNEKEVDGCHVLFVGSSERRRLDSVFKVLNGARVLTVGDMDNFSRQGGMINFTMEENKVRFEINPVVAERAGLKISSKLLGLAKVVKTEDQGR